MFCGVFILILSYKSGTIFSKYNYQNKEIVKDVSFKIAESSSLSIIGETGSGKTIIANSIMNLLPPDIKSTNNEIIFENKNITNYKKIKKLLGSKIIYIPQSGKDALSPNLTIKKHFINILKRNKYKKKDFNNIIAEKLNNVEISNYEEILNKYPFEISGGTAQKIVIALSSCSSASLIIADEMTNGIAEKEKIEKFNLIDRLFPTAGKIYITHDISIAKLCDDILVLNHGKTMEQGPAKKVLTNPHHPYTKALLSSLPENGLNTIPLLSYLKGYCPFYQRCQNRKDKCLISFKKKQLDKIVWYCNYD